MNGELGMLMASISAAEFLEHLVDDHGQTLGQIALRRGISVADLQAVLDSLGPLREARRRMEIVGKST